MSRRPAPEPSDPPRERVPGAFRQNGPHRAMDLVRLAQAPRPGPSEVEQVFRELRHLSAAEGRRIVEPCFAPRVTFPTAALAFRLSGAVPLTELAWLWLADLGARADLPRFERAHWIGDGILDQSVPYVLVLRTFREWLARGVDLEGGGVDQGRPRLVAQLRSGLDRHPSLPDFDAVLYEARYRQGST